MQQDSLVMGRVYYIVSILAQQPEKHPLLFFSFLLPRDLPHAQAKNRSSSSPSEGLDSVDSFPRLREKQARLQTWMRE